VQPASISISLARVTVFFLDTSGSETCARVPKPGKGANSPLWNEVKLLGNDDPRWTEEKHTHECQHCDWSKAVKYNTTIKPGVVSYLIAEVKRHLMRRHKELECVKDHIEKKKISEEKKRKIVQVNMGTASMIQTNPKQMKLNVSNTSSTKLSQMKMPNLISWKDKALCIG